MENTYYIESVGICFYVPVNEGNFDMLVLFYKIAQVVGFWRMVSIIKNGQISFCE